MPQAKKSLIVIACLIVLALALTSIFKLGPLSQRQLKAPEAGTRADFVFSFEISESRLNDMSAALLGQASQGLVQQQSSVEGRFSTVVESVQGNTVRSTGSIDLTKARLALEQDTYLKQDLTFPFEWEQNFESGQVLSLTVDERMSSVGKTFLKSLLARLQIPRLASDPAKNIAFQDIYGTYQLLLDGEAREQGQKLVIKVPTHLPAERSQDDLRRSGSCSVKFQSSGSGLESLNCAEEHEIYLGTKLVLQRKINFLLSQSSQFFADLKPSRPSQTLRPIKDLGLTEERQELQKSLLRKTIGNQSFAAFATNVKTASEQSKTIISDDDYQILKAFIELYPELSAKLIELVKDLNSDNGFFKSVVDVLGAIGHQEAQDALVEMAKDRSLDRQDLPAIERIIPTLALVEKPQASTEKYLAEARHSEWMDLASASTLAYGVIGSRFDKLGDQTLNQKVVQNLLEDYQDSKRPDLKKTVITALGNSGTKENLGIARELLQDKSAYNHLLALEILRFVDSEEARTILLTTIEREAGEMRYEACRSLAYQNLLMTHLQSLHENMKTWTLKDEKSFICMMDIWKNAFKSGLSEIATGSLLWIQLRGPCDQVRQLAKATQLSLGIEIKK